MQNFLIIPDYKDLDTSLALASAYGVGFEYNDFFTPAMLDDTAETDRRIDRYLASDLPSLCTMHGDFFDVLVFSDDREIREISKKRVRQSMDVARRLKAKGVVFHTNHTSFIKLPSYCDNFVNRNKEFFSEICESYPEIDVYMENMFDTEPYLLSRLADEMKDVRNFGVCLDYAHASCFGRDIPIGEWVKSLAPYVKHLHINDNDLTEDQHLPLGDGKIDWEEFAKYYHTCFTKQAPNPSGCTVLVEVNGIDRQKKSLDYLKKLGLLS